MLDVPIARRIVVLVAVALVGGGCAGAAATPAPAPGTVTSRVSPLHDPRGLHPNLTPVPAGERARARKAIAAVATKGRGPKTGYDRDRFGPAWSDAADTTWGHDGCRTREEILHRDLRAVTLRPGTGGCVVLDGDLRDPYTNRFIAFSKSRPLEVQIDHVVPLSYAWQLGAARWSDERRLRFANDPLNLLAVDGPTNAQKGDSGPASWLPPHKAVRCAYAVRIAQVARKYALPVTPPDKVAMRRQCGG